MKRRFLAGLLTAITVIGLITPVTAHAEQIGQYEVEKGWNATTLARYPIYYGNQAKETNLWWNAETQKQVMVRTEIAEIADVKIAMNFWNNEGRATEKTIIEWEDGSKTVDSSTPSAKDKSYGQKSEETCADRGGLLYKGYFKLGAPITGIFDTTAKVTVSNPSVADVIVVSFEENEACANDIMIKPLKPGKTTVTVEYSREGNWEDYTYTFNLEVVRNGWFVKKYEGTTFSGGFGGEPICKGKITEYRSQYVTLDGERLSFTAVNPISVIDSIKDSLTHKVARDVLEYAKINSVTLCEAMNNVINPYLRYDYDSHGKGSEWHLESGKANCEGYFDVFSTISEMLGLAYAADKTTTHIWMYVTEGGYNYEFSSGKFTSIKYR